MLDYYRFVKDVLHLTERDLIESFCNSAYEHNYKKGDYIYRQGDSVNSIPIIYHGIVKGCMSIDEDDKTVVGWILTEPGQTPAPFTTLRDGNQATIESEYDVIAVTDCTIIYIPIFVVTQHLSTSLELSAFYRRILTFCTEKSTIFSLSVLMKNNRSRIEWLVHNEPHLVDLVEQNIIKKEDIASYLHMTPQSLSKFWRKVTKNLH